MGTLREPADGSARNAAQVCSIRMRKLAYLSLGSNLGARAVNLEMAISRLEELGRVKAVSSFYETEPVEVTDQPMFLNCAVALETELMPRMLMRAVLDIEREMGRRRTQAKGPRTIDIDILLYGNAVIVTRDLVIPHPRMAERRFVLQPLADLAPDLRHPVTRQTVREMLAALPDTVEVRTWKTSTRP
jgi:2-amino-4-hydroxy-6-hydroxymethyldihydropteridine diphosphokinase